MKIPLSIRNIYFDQFDKKSRLRGLVDKRIKALKKASWHYDSRIKSEESFVLKLETGRIINPEELEDFFACVLVVENIKSVFEAEDLIKSQFDLVERRPPSDKKTHKSSNCFPFDDLRLYVKWRDGPSVRPTGVDGTLFEFQIKTFLQHAWVIATHDLIYKSDTVDWSKERVAFQIKAMLEHAEVSIQEVQKISRSKLIDKKDKGTEDVLKIIDLLEEFWRIEDLPKNVVRLAQNISLLLGFFNIKLSRLKRILEIETLEERGVKTKNLTPHGIILQSLINQETYKLKSFFKTKKMRPKIFIPEEIEIPKDFF